MANLTLEIVEGKEAGRQIPLDGSVEAGREPGLPLVVDDDQVSRRHARITATAGSVVVEDLGSSNGTYVNDQPINMPRELTPGDRIRMGLTVVELRSAEQVAARPSAVGVIPQITAIGQDVLQPVPAEQLPASQPVSSGAPSVLTEESEPAFVPREVAGDAEAESDYKALANLIDRRVKKERNIAAVGLLSASALAVVLYFALT